MRMSPKLQTPRLAVACTLVLVLAACESEREIPTAPVPGAAFEPGPMASSTSGDCDGVRSFDPFEKDCFCENLGALEFCVFPPEHFAEEIDPGDGEPPEPELDCSPTFGSTERGKRWTCVLTSVPPGATADPQWTFEPDPLVFFAQETVDWLEGSGPNLESMGHEWEGPVVHPGVVRAVIDGETEEDEVNVTDRVEPTPRTWAPDTSLVRGNFLIDPIADSTLGTSKLGALRATGSASASELFSQTFFDVGQVIDGGPNNGYWYVDAPNWQVHHEWDVNQHLLPSATPTLVFMGDTLNRHALGDTLGIMPDSLIRGVERHETTNPRADLVGHWEALGLAIGPGECGNIWEQAEKAVASSDSILIDGLLNDLTPMSENAILWYMDHDRVKDHYMNAGFVVDVSPPGDSVSDVDIATVSDNSPRDSTLTGPPPGCPDPTAQFK